MKMPGINEFAHFHYVSQPVFSPAGKALAFINTAIKNDDYCPELWAVAGEEPYKLCAIAPSMLFTWEDDDHILLAAADAQKPAGEAPAETAAFQRITLPGGGAEAAFALPGDVGDIRHLQGCRYLLLMNDAPPPEEADGATCRVIDELPYWYNGRGYINGVRRRLYLYNDKAKTTAPLTPQGMEVAAYALSADKQYLVCAIQQHNGVLGKTAEIWEYAFASGRWSTLLASEYAVEQIDYWGRNVVFAGNDGEGYGFEGNPKLYLLQAGAARPKQICAWDACIGNVVSSDCRYGEGKVFKVAGDGLFLQAADGYFTRITRVALPDGAISTVSPPQLCCDVFDVSGDSVFMVAFGEGGLQELYRLHGGTCTPVSAFNSACIAQLWQSKPRHLTLQRDGCTIDGWVMLPAAHDPAGQYPAILNIHGGPKVAYGELYYHEMQYWAAQGYFVLFCNPRGSDGKGNAFADIRGRLGSGDYQDIMAFVDLVLASYPEISPNRLGVTGGSYGGFMTNWIIGHTTRFAAAVSQRGVANWVGFAGNSDIGYSFTPGQLGADVWSHPERMWEQSPLKYANKVKTPTLFIHSYEDYRCWVSEAYQMFTALKRHGVSSRMCLFEGENHELSRSGRPANRVRRLREITAWMDRYLSNH